MKRILKTLIALLFIGLAGILTLTGMFFYISSDLPEIKSLNDYRPPLNSQILSRDGEVLLDVGKENREVIAFKEIPELIVKAFLSAEDDNFYNHKGIDYQGILRAFLVNLKSGKLVQGGSTITQQVAKSLLLSRERTITRKIKDLLLARKIEQNFSKEDILFLYLNQVYLGGGYYGVKAAFRGYFDKDLQEATWAEAALVAGLLVAPGRYSPYVNPIYAKNRQRYVLKRIYETGKITEDEYQSALNENIKLRIRQISNFKGGHFTDWIRQEVMSLVGSDEFLTRGFKVITTLDWSLQEKAEKSVLERVKEMDKRQGFKGALKNISADEFEDFILKERAAFLKDQSQFFTFLNDGSVQYELVENEDVLANKKTIEKSESEMINIRWRNSVEIGNQEDTVLKFLKVDSTYPAVVTKLDSNRKQIHANLYGLKVIIPQSGFAWAHERKFGEEPIYHMEVSNPAKILKLGDLIDVKITKLNGSLWQTLPKENMERVKDDEFKKVLIQQKFIIGELDQDPEAEGALISMNSTTGEIISLVGGVNFSKSQFNRVLQSSRQPGSAFKPFIYAAALEAGYEPNTILYDSPQALGGVDDSLNWKPRNYDGKFKGPMTFREALEVSRNIPTIRLVQDVGVKKIHEFIKRINMKTNLPNDMSLSLGSFGVSLAELVKGYAIFPNGGKSIQLKAILSITDDQNKTYPIPVLDQGKVEQEPAPEDSLDSEEVVNENPYTNRLKPPKAYDSRLAYIMTNILRGVILFGTGSAAAQLDAPLGGKTGTTNNYVDAWFVGFSSNTVTGTWVGFDDNKTLGHGETGSKSALPMWMDFMSLGIRKYGANEFYIPPGISHSLIDKLTGKPLAPGVSGGFLESFSDEKIPDKKIVNETGDIEEPTQNPIEDDDYYLNQ